MVEGRDGLPHGRAISVLPPNPRFLHDVLGLDHRPERSVGRVDDDELYRMVRAVVDAHIPSMDKQSRIYLRGVGHGRARPFERWRASRDRVPDRQSQLQHA